MIIKCYFYLFRFFLGQQKVVTHFFVNTFVQSSKIFVIINFLLFNMPPIRAQEETKFLKMSAEECGKLESREEKRDCLGTIRDTNGGVVRYSPSRRWPCERENLRGRRLGIKEHALQVTRFPIGWRARILTPHGVA